MPKLDFFLTTSVLTYYFKQVSSDFISITYIA